jgi:hypothetical protein
MTITARPENPYATPTDLLIACDALDLTARLYGVHQADSRTEIPS